MSETKQLEKLIEGLKTNYKTIFNTAEGKRVLADLEKRCHYHSTTNVKGDSHESAYMEGQRSIEKFTEIDALAKSYINATKMIGQDKVVIPTNNSTEEAWNDVYDKLGRPESAEKYSLDAKSEVVKFDDAAIKSFAEQSHKLGLNNKQAQGILEFYKNNMEGNAQQEKIDSETAHAQAQQQLRQEWGRDYDSKVNQARALFKANINPNLLETQLKDGTLLGDNTEIIKGFAKIASMMQEDKIVATESENVNTTKDLESEISAIMNDKSHPYHVKGHPDHDKSVQQMLTLREMLDAK
jgi:hypothetical protein